jgi:ATP-dependent Clp protease ATP-binding subunit ClpC
METHGVVIELTEEAKELLVENGYDPAMGARPLRRAIQRFIEDPLADFILGRELAPGSTIIVGRKTDVEEGELEVDIAVLPPDMTAEDAVTVPPAEPEAPEEDAAPEE